MATEVERVTQVLVNRMQELEGWHAHSMSALVKQVSDYCERVEAHLKKMGLEY